MKPFEAPIERVLFPKPVPAGMNPLVLLSLAYALRTSADWPEEIEPVVVAPGFGETWQLTHGRHRTVAAMMAGRRYVLATLE